MICLNAHFLANSLNSRAVNCDPLTEMIISGTPYLENIHFSDVLTV